MTSPLTPLFVLSERSLSLKQALEDDVARLHGKHRQRATDTITPGREWMVRHTSKCGALVPSVKHPNVKGWCCTCGNASVRVWSWWSGAEVGLVEHGSLWIPYEESVRTGYVYWRGTERWREPGSVEWTRAWQAYKRDFIGESGVKHREVAERMSAPDGLVALVSGEIHDPERCSGCAKPAGTVTTHHCVKISEIRRPEEMAQWGPGTIQQLQHFLKHLMPKFGLDAVLLGSDDARKRGDLGRIAVVERSWVS